VSQNWGCCVSAKKTLCLGGHSKWNIHCNGVKHLPHPVIDMIDQSAPYFSRKLVRRYADRDKECYIQIWLPVKMDDDVWVSAVHITGVDLLPISGMPGLDPLDALLKAVAFARGVVQQLSEQFLFGDLQWENGGLPISLNRGFSPRQLAELESQATAMRDHAFELIYGHLK